ncbi:hypothetical protein J7L29_04375 [Candidatus Bathyarchaeota archaeon]|nr:hypothetical protein [Candidatus Bathyarchaeota archaeon]
MVKSKSRSINRACLGQARILEAVIASVVIFLAFSVAFYFIYSSENIFAQETVDLNKLAYNVLHQIVESGVIEETIEENPGEEGENQTKIILQELLPANIYFNLTIYNYTDNPLQSSPPDMPPRKISNARAEEFTELGEVASASIIYTSERGNIYYLVLKLARAGGG